MKRASILLAAYNLAGGGAERILANLAEELTLRGASVSCVFFDETFSFPLPHTVAIHVIPLRGFANRKARVLALRELARELEPDAVLSFLSGVNVDVLLALLPLAETSSLFVSEHSTPSLTLLGPANARKRRLVRRFYRRAHGVIAVSRAIADELTGSFDVPERLVSVIHPPVDISAVRRLAGTGAPRTQRAAPLVLNVASLNTHKGHLRLLEAFALLRRRIDARLMIIGEGPEEAAIRRRAGELGMEEHLELLPFQANPFRFMALADAFVLSSFREGFPNVILEAMACGCPVVTSDWPGSHEIVDDGKTGIVAHGGPEALADGMLAVLEGGAAARFSRAASTFVERFERSRIVDQYVHLFGARSGSRWV